VLASLNAARARASTDPRFARLRSALLAPIDPGRPDQVIAEQMLARQLVTSAMRPEVNRNGDTAELGTDAALVRDAGAWRVRGIATLVEVDGASIRPKVYARKDPSGGDLSKLTAARSATATPRGASPTSPRCRPHRRRADRDNDRARWRNRSRRRPHPRVPSHAGTPANTHRTFHDRQGRRADDNHSRPFDGIDPAAAGSSKPVDGFDFACRTAKERDGRRS
jgi:hypothetical protein